MAQGFVQKLDLAESDTRDRDSRALDNLAGAGISEDVILFSNNLRNFDFISIIDIEIDGTDVLKIKPLSPKIAFSNKTKVTHDGVVYTVINSDGETQFSLQDSSGNLLNSNDLVTPITRSLAVTFDNLLNINPKTKETINISEEDIDEINDRYTDQQDTLYINTDTYKNSNLTSLIDSATAIADEFNIVADTKFLSNIANVFDDEYITYNNIFISNINNEPLIGADAPGVYINTAEGQSARIGGNNIDPWETVTGAVQTQSAEINVRNLVAENIQINGLTVDAIDPGEINIAFTHKIPATINGEYYSLCVLQQDTVVT